MSKEEIWQERPVILSKDPHSLSTLIGRFPELTEAVSAVGAICTRRADLKVAQDNYAEDLSLTHPTEGSYKTTLLQATDLVCKFITEGKDILIWGDYDVDGMTATSSLYLTLKAAGANVTWGIPTREDGYGMSTSAIIEKLPHPGLVITVDNGITGNEVTEELNNKSYTVLITDHHLPGEELPKAKVILNPKCYLKEEDDEYMASGCYVAAQLGLQVLNRLHAEKYDEYLQLCNQMVAFSIVSDFIDLNPKLLRQMNAGLVALNNTSHDGIKALLHMCGCRSVQDITSSFLGYSVVPKLNAAGRMSNVNYGMKVLLMEEDKSFNRTDSMVAANDLKALNVKRKLIENQIFDQALEQVPDKVDSALILYGEKWAPGVVGIVASRMVERFNVPTLVLCGKDELHGSGRAPEGVDLHECLAKCSDLLVTFGGHKVAAGLALEQSKYAAFRKKFCEVAKPYVESAKPIKWVDAEVTISDLFDMRFQMFLSNIEPTGNKNPPITLQLSSVYVTGVWDRGDSTCLNLKDERGYTIIVEKYMAPKMWKLLINHKIDVLISPNLNYFSGTYAIYWRIEAIKDYLMETPKKEINDVKPSSYEIRAVGKSAII
jgi:single-stranded-DNA-specific exonuclease